MRCGATEDLDFDHIDAGTKVRNISEATNWALARFLEEVDKCQLLCRHHHHEKSAEAGDVRIVEHGGGVKGKHNCPCTLCKTARRENMRQRRARAASV